MPSTETAWDPAARPDDGRSLSVVHEGRGGHVEIEGARYPIEHVREGHFSIAFPAGNRRNLQAHLEALTDLVRREPAKWSIDNRSKRVAISPAPPRQPPRAG